MNEELPARDFGEPFTLAERLRFLLRQRAEREGRKRQMSTYALEAALTEQEKAVGRMPPDKDSFVTAAFLGNLLRGEQPDPRMSVLIALAEFFQCSIDDLAAPVRDQAELLARLRQAGLQDIALVASLPPNLRQTLRTMLQRVEEDGGTDLTDDC